MSEVNEITINAETEEIIVRKLSETEISNLKKQGDAIEAEMKKSMDKYNKDRQALLDRLGITEEEARLLLG